MQRLHIIDFDQAIHPSVAAKYDGVSATHLTVPTSLMAPVLQKTFACVQVLRRRLRTVSALLFGNNDANGKNISFHLEQVGSNVAELHGLLRVVQYDSKNRRPFSHSVQQRFREGAKASLLHWRTSSFGTTTAGHSSHLSWSVRTIVNMCHVSQAIRKQIV